MPKFFEGETKGGTPQAPWPQIYRECVQHKYFVIKVLTETEYITEQQRKWYKGVCLPFLAARNDHAETIDWWDTEVKSKCKGLAYLKKEGIVVEIKLGDEITRVTIGRLTTKGVGKKNMTNFINEILSVSNKEGWGLTAPNKELRSNK
jgi:hypothetical protein